jgi:hypothetical protein
MVNKKASGTRRRIRPSVLVALSAVLLAAGFVYDLLFAGIPYQDPTPDMTARYEYHAAIASLFYWTAGVTIVMSAILKLVLKITFLLKK